jgi:hypothetical protein
MRGILLLKKNSVFNVLVSFYVCKFANKMSFTSATGFISEEEKQEQFIWQDFCKTTVCFVYNIATYFGLRTSHR